MQENQISHSFSTNETNQRGYDALLQIGQFRKNAEEGRRLIENATPKSTRAVKKYSLKKLFWNGGMIGKQKSSTRALSLWSAIFFKIMTRTIYVRLKAKLQN